MKLKIDIKKSIEKGRLYPKSKLTFYFDYFMYGFFALAFLFYILVALNESNYHVSLGLAIGILFYLFLIPLTFYSLNKMNKLTVMNIKDKSKTIQFIQSLATESKWKIFKADNQILVIQTNPWYLHERQVTFIFSYGKVFINVMSFGRDIMSPIYYSSDKEILKSIIEKLSENKITQ